MFLPASKNLLSVSQKFCLVALVLVTSTGHASRRGELPYPKEFYQDAPGRASAAAPQTQSWAHTYLTKDGSSIQRTPQNIIVGGCLSVGKSLSIEAREFNGIPLKAPLQLSLNQTRAEFEAALRKAGVI